VFQLGTADTTLTSFCCSKYVDYRTNLLCSWQTKMCCWRRKSEVPEDKINILAVISFTDFLDVILRTKTINIRNITSVGNGRILHN